ncbi:MAG: hypothetical protein GXP41_06500 [Chloroflexi bacterium]|nr:hypothetical protein [Chloroflexota bacterium]
MLQEVSHFSVDHLQKPLQIIQGHVICDGSANNDSVFRVAQDQATPFWFSYSIPTIAPKLKSIGMRRAISPSRRDVALSSVHAAR